MSVSDYIKVYDNFLSKDECDLFYKDINWKGHTWSDDNGNVVTDNNDLYVNQLDSKFSYISDKFQEVTEQYTAYTQINRKNMTSQSSIPRLNRYVKGQHMAPHVDHIRSLFDGERKGIPLLSSIILLNDNFKGGELLFDLKFERKKVSPLLEKGSIIIWPSCFIYEHEVTPIIEGERISLVTWFW